jgi:hypothetical protein
MSAIKRHLDNFRYIFFPDGFEKYGYLGVHLRYTSDKYFEALYPLVLAMDYEAKPKRCPRWFLRLLHVVAHDRSLVRVKNRKVSDYFRKLTKGILFIDWKTKWHDNDLRISISAPTHIWNLADDIADGFYRRGENEEQNKKILE